MRCWEDKADGDICEAGEADHFYLNLRNHQARAVESQQGGGDLMDCLSAEGRGLSVNIYFH